MIAEIVNEADLIDNECLNIEYDSGGRVTSVHTDTAKLNRIQNVLRSGLNDKLSECDHDAVTLTIGDLTNIELFSGKGAELSFDFQRAGMVSTEISSELLSAGINQTRFRVVISVTVEFKAFLPGGAQTITVTQDYIAADTLIVGKVPDIYPSGSLYSQEINPEKY